MITLLILYFWIVSILKKIVEKRWDGSPRFPYYEASDLGVSEERFSFMSGKWKLDGSRYFVGPGPYKAVVVCFHGISAGRTAYLRQTCDFAKSGYLVYAFDYTGCMRSEGTYSYGLGHVIQDIRAFYKFLDKDEKARDLQRYSYGHSWGGYCALLTALPEFHVSKIVSLSGFISELDEYTSLAPQTNNFLIRFLIKIRGRVNTPGGPLSVIPGMEKTTAKILYVQGKDDEVVPWSRSGEVLAKKFANKNNISFMFVPGRNHSIMSTPGASVYFKGLLAQGINEINGPVGLTMDLDKSTEEDKEVTKATFDFFLS